MRVWFHEGSIRVPYGFCKGGLRRVLGVTSRLCSCLEGVIGGIVSMGF